jgi:hypothetical protein
MKLVRLVVVLLVIAGVSVFTATMLMVAYPGAFEWTAPVLCPEDKPDAFVVHYNVQTSDGNGTNFTMFCMGRNGQFTEVGTWRPLAILTVGVAGGVVVLVALFWLGSRGARSPRAGGERPDEPPDTPQDAPPGEHRGVPVDRTPVDAPPPAVPPPPPV